MWHVNHSDFFEILTLKRRPTLNFFISDVIVRFNLTFKALKNIFRGFLKDCLFEFMKKLFSKSVSPPVLLIFICNTVKPRLTDLCRIIGIFDCRYSTVWKFSKSPAFLIMDKINFSWFKKDKNCCFNNFASFEFWFFKKSHLKCQMFPKI